MIKNEAFEKKGAKAHTVTYHGTATKKGEEKSFAVTEVVLIQAAHGYLLNHIAERELHDKHLANFLRCIHKTVRDVFPEVMVTPGDTAYFIAGKEKGYLSLDPDFISKRIYARGIETDFFSECYLPSILSAERTGYLNEILKQDQGVWINKDLRPVCYFYDLILWGRFFSPLIGSFLEKAKKIDGRNLLLYILIVSILFMSIRFSGKERSRRINVGIVVFLGGFVEIILEFLLILSFQVFYGYAYLELGVLIAAFMVGLSIGSALMTHIIDRLTRVYRWYCGIQISYFLYPLLILFFLIVIEINLWPAIAVECLFTLLAVLAGLMGGIQFPVATKLFLPSNRKWKSRAGLLYGLDLTGAALGAILASSYLVPLYGILSTLLFLSLAGFIGVIFLMVNI